jgi:hypothetical protein
MTSQPEPDVDGHNAPAKTEADERRDSDTLAKSYRYLRLAMVGLLLCLAVAVIAQTINQWDVLDSVSAYYYTPAQAFFVGGLIGLGACMIALKGTTLVQDIALNLGGAFAAIVAIVPTGRPADENAVVDACEEAGTPLLTEKAEKASTEVACPRAPALEDATTANVDNNLWALLVVGAFALGAAYFVARKDGTLADGPARRKFWWGFGWAFGLWLAVGIARTVLFPQWVMTNAHWIAALSLFVCIFVVGSVNALQVKREKSGKPSRETPSLGEAVSQTAGDLIAVAGKNKRKDWHIRIARWMLVVAAVTGVLWGFTDLITLFVLEGAVFLLFMLFWTVQTFELERERERSMARRPGFLDRFRRHSRSATSTSTDVQGHANS